MQAKEETKRKRIERHEILKNAEILRSETSLELSHPISSSSGEENSEDSDDSYIRVNASTPSTSKRLISKRPKKL